MKLSLFVALVCSLMTAAYAQKQVTVKNERCPYCMIGQGPDWKFELAGTTVLISNSGYDLSEGPMRILSIEMRSNQREIGCVSKLSPLQSRYVAGAKTTAYQYCASGNSMIDGDMPKVPKISNEARDVENFNAALSDVSYVLCRSLSSVYGTNAQAYSQVEKQALGELTSMVANKLGIRCEQRPATREVALGGVLFAIDGSVIKLNRYEVDTQSKQREIKYGSKVYNEVSDVKDFNSLLADIKEMSCRSINIGAANPQSYTQIEMQTLGNITSTLFRKLGIPGCDPVSVTGPAATKEIYVPTYGTNLVDEAKHLFGGMYWRFALVGKSIVINNAGHSVVDGAKRTYTIDLQSHQREISCTSISTLANYCSPSTKVSNEVKDTENFEAALKAVSQVVCESSARVFDQSSQYTQTQRQTFGELSSMVSRKLGLPDCNKK